MSNRKALATASVCLVAIALSTIVIVRAIWIKPPNPIDVVFSRTRSDMSALSLTPLSDRNAIETALKSMSFQGESTASQREVLAGFLTDAIEFYYLRESPAAYKAWRRETGVRLQSRAEMDAPSPWPLHDSIQFVNDVHKDEGFLVDAAADVETLFDQLWTIRRKIFDGSNQPVAIANDSAGLLTVFRRSSYPRIFHEFNGSLGMEAWFGGAVVSNRVWFQDAQLEALMSSTNVVAQSGIVFEFADGIRRPLIFLSVWDPNRNHWRLRYVVMTNWPAHYFAWPWEL